MTCLPRYCELREPFGFAGIELQWDEMLENLVKAADGNFVVHINNFCVYYLKKKNHNTHRQLFVNDVLCWVLKNGTNAAVLADRITTHISVPLHWQSGWLLTYQHFIHYVIVLKC